MEKSLRDGSRVPCELFGEVKAGKGSGDMAGKKRAAERKVCDRGPKMWWGLKPLNRITTR